MVRKTLKNKRGGRESREWREWRERNPGVSPSEILSTLRHNGMALENVEDQMEDFCRAAVKQNGLALQFVEVHTPEVMMAAVKQNGLALQFAHWEREDVCLAAVKENGMALEFVHDKTEKICRAAVKQNKSARRFVPIEFDHIVRAMRGGDENEFPSSSWDNRASYALNQALRHLHGKSSIVTPYLLDDMAHLPGYSRDKFETYIATLARFVKMNKLAPAIAIALLMLPHEPRSKVERAVLTNLNGPARDPNADA